MILDKGTITIHDVFATWPIVWFITVITAISWCHEKGCSVKILLVLEDTHHHEQPFDGLFCSATLAASHPLLARRATEPAVQCFIGIAPKGVHVICFKVQCLWVVSREHYQIWIGLEDFQPSLHPKTTARTTIFYIYTTWLISSWGAVNQQLLFKKHSVNGQIMELRLVVYS